MLEAANPSPSLQKLLPVNEGWKFQGFFFFFIWPRNILDFFFLLGCSLEFSLVFVKLFCPQGSEGVVNSVA